LVSAWTLCWVYLSAIHALESIYFIVNIFCSGQVTEMV
jgi:hypothetical protein